MVLFKLSSTKLRMSDLNLDLTLTEAINNNHVRIAIEQDTNNFSRNSSSGNC